MNEIKDNTYKGMKYKHWTHLNGKERKVIREAIIELTCDEISLDEFENIVAVLIEGE